MSDKDHNSRVPRPAHNYVPEYQQSGIPFVRKITLIDGTAVALNFDFLTRWVIIKNTSDTTITFGFNGDANQGINENTAINVSADGIDLDPQDAGGHKYTRLPFVSLAAESETQRLELKCKQIFFKGVAGKTIEVIAGLTNIRSSDFPDQTAANGFTGVE